MPPSICWTSSPALAGVGNVTVFGAGQYAMRIWLDPEKMQARGLTPRTSSRRSISRAAVTAGQLGLPPVPAGQTFQYTINVPSKLDDVAQFEDIIVKTDKRRRHHAHARRGRVELGAQQYSQTFKLDGQPSAGIAIFQLPEANALEVAKRVDAKMGELAKAFPQGMTYGMPFDTTKFVSASIHEVYKTLIEAAMLVLIVILVFLQDWRATLVPATTVPVTIIGAFAAMAVFGFTVNLSTLFAIILAIGIVVDDAIVVVEGAAKHIEHGMSPPRRRHQGDGRAARPDHRHHAGADGGVHAGGVPAGPDRADVSAVRAGDRGHGADQRHQRRDAEADAMRPVAAPARAAGAAQRLLPRLQPRL